VSRHTYDMKQKSLKDLVLMKYVCHVAFYLEECVERCLFAWDLDA
jgi:hypothetical protein